MSEKILISGANGFIGSHIVEQLLAKNYVVVGTVRSVEEGSKLLAQFANSRLSFEIVKDINDDNAFDNFVQLHPDASVFIHTVSPLYFGVTDIVKEILEPALKGVQNALNAAHKYGPQIKRFVFTSSYGAIGDHANPDIKRVENEDSWCPLTWESSQASPYLGYCGSKTIAEKYAWNFVKEVSPRFDLTAVNPTVVFGPQTFDEQAEGDYFASAQFVFDLLQLPLLSEDWPHFAAAAVDVRDVAAAHIVAFEKDEARSQRLFLTSGPCTDQTILDVVHRDFPQETKDIPIGVPGNQDKVIEDLPTLENERTRRILGFKLRTVEESVHDTAEQILRFHRRKDSADLTG